MGTLKLNELAFKSFDYLKVNERYIKFPEIKIDKYKIESDEKIRIKEFENKDYSVSKELLMLNNNSGNLYKYYETKKSENKDFGLIELKTDDENQALLDTHDIVANENSELKLILDYKTIGDKNKFRNSIIRILAKEASDVKVHIIQRENEKSLSLESIYIETKENANVEVYQYELGAKKLYANFMADIIGESSSIMVDSIYFAHNNHDIDFLYNIFHYGKETRSSVILNGVLKEYSSKVFKSNLDFKEGCTKADGTEEEYVLMLDNSCKNIAVPLLLCHEDDVKGNHAASSGNLDQDTMFYLMTRGLDEKMAELIVIESKFSRAIDALQNEEVENEIWKFIRDIIKDEKNG